MKKISTFLKEQQGVTAIETAIILIAFVVVAAVFAFTVLSSGMRSTERAQQAIRAGLSEVQSSMEIRGSVLALDTDDDGAVDEIVFTVATAAAAADPVDLTAGDDRVVVIDYRDASQRVTNIDWSVDFIVEVNQNNLLEARELAEITVPLSDLDSPLGANTTFLIEIKPPTGGVLVIQRTTPPNIDAVNDLS